MPTGMQGAGATAPYSNGRWAVQSMSGTSPSDVWAVGAAGVGPPLSGRGIPEALVDHWDGSSWRLIDTPRIPAAQFQYSTGVVLNGVAAIASNNVWAVGGYATPHATPYIVSWNQTLVEHWDGTQWRTVAAPDLTPNDELTAISAVAADDIWAVGDASYHVVEGPPPSPSQSPPFDDVAEPFAEHWDGTAWSLVSVPRAAVDPTNVAAVEAEARNGAILDGAFNAVHAVSSTDVWAVGGFSWQSFTSPRPDATLVDHWDGSSWTNIAAPDQSVAELGHDASDDLLAVDGTSASGLWAVGAAAPVGTLAIHRLGSSWSIVPSPHTGYRGYFSDVAVLGAANVWAAGDSVGHWDGRTWSDMPTVNGSSVGPMRGMAALNSNDIWFAGETAFLHYTCT